MPFWDVSVTNPASKLETRVLALQAAKLGYNGIVLNKLVTFKLQSSHTAGAEPADGDVEWAKDLPSGFVVKSRITLVLDDPNQAHYLNGSNAIVKSYDIVAARPTSEKLLHQCCQHLEVDVISLDLSQKLRFHIKRPVVHLAFERGIVFEIAFSPGLRDPAARRNLISNALSLVRITRGKNIVLSSEARDALELRSPYDIINLALLFGLNEEQAVAALSSNARSVIIHAETRRTFKSVLRSKPLSETFM